MSIEIQTRTIQIPADQYAACRAKFMKLSKRAAKLGLHSLTLDASDVYHIPDPDHPGRKLAKIDCTIPSADVKLHGWTLLAKLDHATAAPAVLVDAVPGIELDPKWRTAAAHCEHCRFQRRRNLTYVCQHENGQIKQIGSTCLKDFLGHDPSQAFALLQEIWKEFNERCAPYGDGAAGFDPLDVIAVTIAIVDEYGWISKARAAEDTTERTKSTASEVWFYYNYTGDNGEIRASIEKTREQALAAHRRAQAVLDWVSSESADSDYMHNLQALLAADFIPLKRTALFCSAVGAYRRAMSIREEHAQHLDAHFGTVGERVEISGTVERMHSFETDYGLTTIIVIRLTSGCALVWFASRPQQLDVGDKVNGKVTVKAHQEYNGKPQTRVTRCALTKV